MFIYSITNKVNNKIYIGQSTLESFKDRYYKGQWWKRTKNTHLRSAFQKYGAPNFEIKILEKCNSLDELNSKEIEYIKKFNSTDPKNGYNFLKGGSRGRHSPRSKRAISDAKKGQTPWLGKTHSEESKRKISEAKKGTKYSNEYKQNMAKIKGSSEFAVFFNGLEVWSGINKSQCARDLKLNVQCISKCLNGKEGRTQHKGYIFRSTHE